MASNKMDLDQVWIINGPCAISLSLWNSEAGNLIQEQNLPLPAFNPNGSIGMVDFEIEGNHLVLLVNDKWGVDEHQQYKDHILIDEMDKVLAGDNTKPRDIFLRRNYYPIFVNC